MADRRHFEKLLNRHISATVYRFWWNWHDDANCRVRPLKFRIFQKPRWWRQPSWKITKIAISQQRIGRSSRNFAWLCKMGLLTTQTVKKWNFQNPRWRAAAIIKSVKSPYLRKRLTDFDEIWHGDADWPPTGDRPLKFRIFQKPRWRRPPSWKSQKSRYHNKGLTDSTAWTIFTKFGTIIQIGLLTVLTVKKFEFPKSKMADGRQYENR